MDSGVAGSDAAELQLLLDMEQLQEEMARLVDHGELAETCQLQLAELEMLAAMFPLPGELKVIDPAAVQEMTAYVDGSLKDPPARLDYTVVFRTDQIVWKRDFNCTDGCGQGKLELSVHLPLDYPNVEPDLFVRSDGLNRTQSHNINRHLATRLQSMEPGQLYVGSVISWLQDNSDQFLHNASPVKDEPVQEESADEFARLWIYSHHIYSKTKRRDMQDAARDCGVTGFVLPGKPGIICVEGPASAAADWWKRVKSWNWKRIMVKKKEVLELSGRPVDALRLFPQFEEISFSPSSRPGREHHMDMGQFFQYLEEHHCAQVFKDYFGISGRAGGAAASGKD